ncbi:MAG: serine protease [Bacteroidales bacterium]|nr:serine protease [Bacteroidales bacterium]
MKHKYLSLITLAAIVVATTLLTACNNRAETLVERNASGVVLIQNISYYSMELADGEVIYFSDYNDEDGIKGLETDLDSVQPMVTHGTGFFISDDGKIATNLHVVSGQVDANRVQRSLSRLFSALKSAAEDYRSDLQEELTKVKIALAYVGGSDATLLKIYGQELEEEIAESNALIKAIDEVDPRNAEPPQYHSKIGVAYNNTHINSIDQFIPCTVIKKSDNAEIDLAVIQLNDKKTPAGRKVYTVPAKDMLAHYSFPEYIMRLLGSDKNSNLMLLGFNYGTAMGITSEGLICQHPEGKVTRDEGKTVLYTIPTLHGSSGSPVINRRGQLVAVNYAGLDNTQNYNWGVKAINLYKLLNQ